MSKTGSECPSIGIHPWRQLFWSPERERERERERGRGRPCEYRGISFFLSLVMDKCSFPDWYLGGFLFQNHWQLRRAVSLMGWCKMGPSQKDLFVIFSQEQAHMGGHVNTWTKSIEIHCSCSFIYSPTKKIPDARRTGTLCELLAFWIRSRISSVWSWGGSIFLSRIRIYVIKSP